MPSLLGTGPGMHTEVCKNSLSVSKVVESENVCLFVCLFETCEAQWLSG